jgi:hypothetical protein
MITCTGMGWRKPTDPINKIKNEGDEMKEAHRGLVGKFYENIIYSSFYRRH